MSKGFTLLEMMAAVFVIALAVGSLYSLLSQSVVSTGVANSELAATYLAQEGVEIARNIRDSNLLKLHKGLSGAWTDGLAGCSLGCEADYKSTSLASQDRFLNLASGFYSYDAGTQTPYKRKIFVTQSSADILDVVVQVTWQEHSRAHTISGATKLYNWIAPTP